MTKSGAGVTKPDFEEHGDTRNPRSQDSQPPRPHSALAALSPYVGGRSRIAGHSRVIKLSANESALGPSPRAMAAYRAAAATLHRYPDGGCEALRNALAQRFGLHADHIVCGNGSDELISLLVRAYAGAGDEVVISQYGFLYYAVAAQAVGAVPVYAPETDYTADCDALATAVTARTRLLFLANPNNPTASYLTRTRVEHLLSRIPRRVLVVLDAAYAEYMDDDDYEAGAAWVESHDNVVMLRTFSKIFALSALRLGWCYAPLPVVDVLNRLRGPFNVNRAAQDAAVAALDDHDYLADSLAHTARWRTWLSTALGELGLTVYPSVTNFILVAFPAGGHCHAEAAATFLEQRGILPRRVDNYGLPDCLRFTLGTQEENQAVVAALRDFLHANTSTQSTRDG